MNTLTHYFIPQWLIVLFLLSILLPLFSLARLLKKSVQANHQNRVFYWSLGALLLYVSYVFIACWLGFFDKTSVPPAVLLYTTFPFAIGLLFFYNTKGFKNTFANTQLDSLVECHIFRLLGLFFVLLACYDAIPRTFALIAGIGDMVTAITSIFVAKAIKEKKTYARKLTYIWNTFGLIDILFTAIAANVINKISIETGTMGVDSLARFPFCFIPAFAPPTILFLHLLIYQKLKKN